MREIKATIEEVDNGFILEIDGWIGSRKMICSSIQDVSKELLGYYKEREDAVDEEVSEKKSE